MARKAREASPDATGPTYWPMFGKFFWQGKPPRDALLPPWGTHRSRGAMQDWQRDLLSRPTWTDRDLVAAVCENDPELLPGSGPRPSGLGDRSADCQSKILGDSNVVVMLFTNHSNDRTNSAVPTPIISIVRPISIVRGIHRNVWRLRYHRRIATFPAIRFALSQVCGLDPHVVTVTCGESFSDGEDSHSAAEASRFIRTNRTFYSNK